MPWLIRCIGLLEEFAIRVKGQLMVCVYIPLALSEDTYSGPSQGGQACYSQAVHYSYAWPTLERYTGGSAGQLRCIRALSSELMVSMWMSRVLRALLRLRVPSGPPALYAPSMRETGPAILRGLGLLCSGGLLSGR
jgi:hypothetical protein